MPTYDYSCPNCGAFEAVRRIAERDAAVACPGCSAPATRQTLTMPGIPGRRAGVPEEGQEAGRYGGMRHMGDCACCPPAAPKL